MHASLPLLSLVLYTTSASAVATVYLIRHGEKPSSGNGLSTKGQERAQWLRTVFAANSTYNIGHIMAETPQSSMYILYIFPYLSFPGIFRFLNTLSGLGTNKW